jgi:hypothetical protein
MHAAVKDAVDLALFFRRGAHRRRRMQRVLMPEWNGQANHLSDSANQTLRQAIRWIQIAKYRRERFNG